MSPALAWFTALAVASGSVAPAGVDPAAAPAPDAQAGVVVPLNLGPPVVRRMGVRITVRRAGDDPIMHRPVDVRDLPPPATTDDAPAPARIELPPGSYVLEAETPGYLPSTRAVNVAAGASVAAVDWQMLPDTSHRTVQLSVVAPSAAAPPTVALTARHLAGEQQPVVCTARRVPCELRLLRGEWEVEASAPGFLPLKRVVAVGDAEGQAIELSLAPGLVDRSLPDASGIEQPPTPEEPAPDERRRRMRLTLSFASVPLFAAGLSLAVAGRVRYGQWLQSASCESYGSTCADGIIPQIHVASLGAGLTGAAIGLLSTGLTALKDVPRGVWWTELAVGGALTVAGGAWLIGNSVLLDRDLKTGPLAEIGARNDRRFASSFFLGAGLGFVTGSVAGLLLRKPPRRATALSPFGGPGLGGVSLSGRF